MLKSKNGKFKNKIIVGMPNLNRIGDVDLDESHLAAPDIRAVVSIAEVSGDDHHLTVVRFALLQHVDVQQLRLDVWLLLF